VDEKDARWYLDLDPDRTLVEQLPQGVIDEFGNAAWDGRMTVTTVSFGMYLLLLIGHSSSACASSMYTKAKSVCLLKSCPVWAKSR
jgi:hypothetical protein